MKRDEIIEILRKELFPMQLVNDDDPIEICGIHKAADKILALTETEEEQFNKGYEQGLEHCRLLQQRPSEEESEKITIIHDEVLSKRFPNPGNVSDITWEAYLRGAAKAIIKL